MSAPPTDGTTVPPRLSATVLLLRESRGGAEVLLQRRAAGMAFSAQWVFPGGTVAAVDGNPAEDLHGTLRRAAIRETQEETGVRLEGGTAQARLVPWSRWITPAVRTRRFDAWFFVAQLPEGESATGDGTEAVETEWIAPEAALEAREQGRVAMMPPTVVNLLDIVASLREHGSIAALLEAERAREIVPILPRLVELPEGVFTVYPWDPAYDTLPGEGVPLERVPRYLQRLPSRMRAPRVQP